MKLLEIWKANLEKAYELQTSFLVDENGFINPFSGNIEDFQRYVKDCKDRSQGLHLPQGYVPDTTYVIENNDGEYVGILKFRHELNDFLRNGSGHVGFGIRKEYRGRGYATKALELIKNIAREKGIDELYLSCNKTNHASRKVQMKCGAYLYKTTDDHYLFRIPLKRKITLLVACHKKSETPKDTIYLPIQVGAFGKEDIGYVRDDSQDNISQDNDRYCELTGLYWAIKHIETSIIGLVHYRRYFLSTRHTKQKNILQHVIGEKEILSLLEHHKVLVPKKRKYYIQTLWKHYADTFTAEHLEKTREILTNSYPQYVETFDEVMQRTSGYMFNMFIMKKELAKNYADWLFSILKEVDSAIDSTNYTAFEKRYLGRVSERLFNVWLAHEIKEGRLEEKDIYELPYAYLGKVKWGKKIIGFLAAKLFHKKYRESF